MTTPKLDWDDNPDYNAGLFVRQLRALWELCVSEHRSLKIATALMAFTQFLGLGLPFVFKLIFDELYSAGSMQGSLATLGWLLGALLALKLFATSVRQLIQERRFAASLIRLENLWPVLAHEKLLALPMNYHEKENTGKKVAKIDHGCAKLVDATGLFYWKMLPLIMYIIFTCVIMVAVDWKIALIFFVPFLLVSAVGYSRYGRIIAAWEEWERMREVASGKFCQSLINVRTVQNFVQERHEAGGFSSIRYGMRDLDLRVTRKVHVFFWLMDSLLGVTLISAIGAGVYFAMRGWSTPGTVVYLIATGSVIVQSFGDLIHNYLQLSRMLVPVMRMKELLDQPVDINNQPEAIIPKEFGGRFELNRISFVYPGKETPVLEGLSLTLQPNQMIAFVGKSGEGKTTLVRLLCRMYDIQKGEISLDGIDIKSLDRDWYRRHFAVVQQDVDIFDASLFENIRYPYAEAEEAEVLESLHAAHLDVVIEDAKRFPKGLQTEVGERGIKLSGGERQRVGIARAYLALLRGARVLVLDEATSNLDSEAEKAIQQMIGVVREKLSISIVAIAHRLSTIHRADMIYVLDGGRIIEQGDHAKLMRGNGLYAKLVELQGMNLIRE